MYWNAEATLDVLDGEPIFGINPTIIIVSSEDASFNTYPIVLNCHPMFCPYMVIVDQ